MKRSSIVYHKAPDKRILTVAIISIALFSAGLVTANAHIALALAGVGWVGIISWITLIGLGWWRKYSDWYVLCFFLSILSGNVYLMSFGSTNLWISFSDFFLPASLVILFYELQKNRIRGRNRLVALTLLTFLLLVLARGLFAEQPTQALAAIKVVGSGLLAFLVTSQSRFDDRSIGQRLFPVIWLWAVGLLITTVVSLVSVVRNSGLSLQVIVLHKIDYTTPLGRSNYLAALALLLWPVSLYGMFVTPWGLRKALGVIATLCLVVMPLLVYSRGALIVFATTFFPVLIFGWLVLRGRQSRTTASHQILVMPILVLLIGVLAPKLWRWISPLAQQAQALIVSPGTWKSYSTAQARFHLWMHAWSRFMENPVLGQGLYNVVSVNAVSGAMLLVHNLPLQLLSETGILGTVLYGLASGLVAVGLARAMNRIRWGENQYTVALIAGLLAAMGVALLNSLIEANFLTRDFDLLFWGLMGCAWAGARSAISGEML